MSYLTFPGYVGTVSSMADRTCKVTIRTQELGTDAGELMNLHGEFVTVALRTGEGVIDELDIPEPPKDSSRLGKSPSQMQRAVLYRIWEAKGKPGKSSELYYNYRMEQFNKGLIEELDKLTN